MASKPVVYFRGPVDQVGGRAILTPINHPSPLVSNTRTILTSTVLQWHNDRIETENTIYVRID